MFKVLSALKIVQNAVDTDLTLAASWSAATDLGDIKGKPFLKATCDPDLTADTQWGIKQFSFKAHFETSTLKLDSVTAAALDTMVRLNVSLLAIPAGTVGADNPILVVRNFLLQSATDREIGDVSFRKLSGDKPVYAEVDAFEELTEAPGV